MPIRHFSHQEVDRTGDIFTNKVGCQKANRSSRHTTGHFSGQLWTFPAIFVVTVLVVFPTRPWDIYGCFCTVKTGCCLRRPADNSSHFFVATKTSNFSQKRHTTSIHERFNQNRQSPQYPNSFSALNNLGIGSLKCASGRFVSEMYIANISSGFTGFHTAGRLLFDFAALSQFLTDLIDDRETRSDRPSDLTLAMNSFSTVKPWCSLH